MQALLFALALLLLCSIVEGGVLGWLRRLLEGRRGPVFVDDKADTYKDEKIKELKSEILILTDQLREMKRILNSNKDMTNQGRREKMILQKQYEELLEKKTAEMAKSYETLKNELSERNENDKLQLVQTVKEQIGSEYERKLQTSGEQHQLAIETLKKAVAASIEEKDVQIKRVKELTIQEQTKEFSKKELELQAKQANNTKKITELKEMVAKYKARGENTKELLQKKNELPVNTSAPDQEERILTSKTKPKTTPGTPGMNHPNTRSTGSVRRNTKRPTTTFNAGAPMNSKRNRP